MRIEYSPDTDSLYVDLAERPGADAREIGEGIVVDIDFGFGFRRNADLFGGDS